jgi:hypothetical protein
MEIGLAFLPPTLPSTDYLLHCGCLHNSEPYQDQLIGRFFAFQSVLELGIALVCPALLLHAC